MYYMYVHNISKWLHTEKRCMQILQPTARFWTEESSSTLIDHRFEPETETSIYIIIVP